LFLEKQRQWYYLSVAPLFLQAADRSGLSVQSGLGGRGIVTNLINEKANNLSVDYKELSIELKDFKKNYKYDSVIYNVRNKVAAHIEDFQLYFRRYIQLIFF
jgi:hypothetical protein